MVHAIYTQNHYLKRITQKMPVLCIVKWWKQMNRSQQSQVDVAVSLVSHGIVKGFDGKQGHSSLTLNTRDNVCIHRSASVPQPCLWRAGCLLNAVVATVIQ